MRLLSLLLCLILLAPAASPFVRPAPRPRNQSPKALTAEDTRRLLRMQKRDRQMDRAMAKRAKSG